VLPGRLLFLDVSAIIDVPSPRRYSGQLGEHYEFDVIVIHIERDISLLPGNRT